MTVSETLLKKEVRRQLRALDEEFRYIGSCVDVGKGGKPVCDYFADATELSNIVDNERKHERISEKTFFRHVDRADVPGEALEGETWYYAVTYSPVPGETLSVEESGMFYIYNLDKDIHYFFDR